MIPSERCIENRHQWKKLGARVIEVDSFETNHEGQKAIDNNPATLWHTEWSNAMPGYPHQITIDMERPVSVKGITYLPRQDNNRNGWIKEYAVYISNDLDNWEQPIATGSFPEDAALKTVEFNKSTPARYLRLEAVKGFDNDVFTSIAELNVILK